MMLVVVVVVVVVVEVVVMVMMIYYCFSSLIHIESLNSSLFLLSFHFVRSL